MITVENLSFTYPSAPSPALRGLTFSLEDGEILGFLGPSGAGKSTTQKILIRLLQGYEGRAEVLGREVRRWDKSLYEQVGVSFELPNHYARLTALENLRHFAAFYRGPTVDPHRVLDWVGLSDAANERAGALSKGMKVRLNLARACMHRPRLLFLDEPTSGLDPAATEAVYATIGMLKARGVTVVLSSHLLPGVEPVIDRALILGEGKCLALGDLASLRERFALPYVIEMRGAPQDLALRLIREGIPARSSLADGGRLRLEVAPEHRMNALRLCTAFQGLKDLEIRPPSLEALYRRVQDPSGRDPGNGSQGSSESDASDRYQVIDESDHTTVSPSAEDTP